MFEISQKCCIIPECSWWWAGRRWAFAFLHLLFVALLPLSATHPSPAASISLPFHYYCLSIFCSHFFPLPGYDSHWSPWTRFVISSSILHQVKIISSAFLQPLQPSLWLDDGAGILECLSSSSYCSRHAASSSSIHLLIRINLCRASLLPPTICDLYVCAFVLFLSLHQPLFTISRFPPPSLSLISSAAMVRIECMLIDLKAMISCPIKFDWFRLNIFCPITPLFPYHPWLFFVCLMSKPV